MQKLKEGYDKAINEKVAADDNVKTLRDQLSEKEKAIKDAEGNPTELAKLQGEKEGLKTQLETAETAARAKVEASEEGQKLKENYENAIKAKVDEDADVKTAQDNLKKNEEAIKELDKEIKQLESEIAAQETA